MSRDKDTARRIAGRLDSAAALVLSVGDFNRLLTRFKRLATERYGDTTHSNILRAVGVWLADRPDDEQVRDFLNAYVALLQKPPAPASAGADDVLARIAAMEHTTERQFAALGQGLVECMRGYGEILGLLLNYVRLVAQQAGASTVEVDEEVRAAIARYGEEGEAIPTPFLDAFGDDQDA